MKRNKQNIIRIIILSAAALTALMVCSYHFSKPSSHVENKLGPGPQTQEEPETETAENDSLYEEDDKEDDEEADVPYLRMPESRVLDTSLGSLKYTKVTIKKRVRSYFLPVTTYTFYEDNEIVFVVECVLGEVYEVYDYRDQIHSKRKRRPYYPEVDEYDDPLDFYYFYPDDFLDYEDAENYYYEHGGE